MKNKHSINSTSIAGGEGKTEINFLDYIKRIYTSRENNHSIHIAKNTHGGDTISVAIKVMNLFQGREFDAILLFIDNDRAKNYACDGLIKKAKKRCPKPIQVKIPKLFKCIRSYPCTEGFLLKISGESCPGTSPNCKSQFKTKFGKDADAFTQRDYEKHFSKALLDDKRGEIPELNELIRYFEIATKADFSSYFGG